MTDTSTIARVADGWRRIHECFRRRERDPRRWFDVQRLWLRTSSCVSSGDEGDDEHRSESLHINCLCFSASACFRVEETAYFGGHARSVTFGVAGFFFRVWEVCEI